MFLMDCDLPLSNAIALVPLFAFCVISKVSSSEGEKKKLFRIRRGISIILHHFVYLPSVLHVYPPFKVEGFLIKFNLITSKADYGEE